jgi:DNA polymerase III delta subunit
MACWNKVWVLEGEPLYIQYMIKCIQEDLNNPEIAKYSTVSSADTIKSALMAFPFFETPDLIVISEPNADILKMCLQLAESDFSASGLIVTCEHNTFDSRLSFISKAAKNKRVSYYEPLQGSQINKYIKDWATDSGVKIASDSYQWFEKNAPTTISKMKTQNGKKDIIVYDLMSLEKFLNKLEVLYKSEGEPISLEDLKNYSNFKRETDIWAFIDKVFASDMTYIYQYFEENSVTLSNHSILWLIASQLEFLIQVKSSMSKNKNQSQISDMLALKDTLGYYLDNDMSQLKDLKAKAIVNPYRLQMAMQSASKIDLKDLVNKYQATISAIRDLRSGLDGKIVSNLLTLAYSNKNNYLEPFLDV